ncbi:MAG: arginyltransferase [Desulfofustis sp.]|nr:arginyltransferase [Desulfofustis sp.]MBT8354180.1 arginyltransferase [Desulfofustis sp.]NNK12676.1 arginyltransferase [Desulfofustis sp.]NNK55752.1 arginyltransferase [Desulfofustis sp.]
MSVYDRQCEAEFVRLQSRLDRYFINMSMECPYQLPYTATFYQALFGPITDRIMELFLAAGYRRNGNSLYTMRCAHCNQCIPIRLHPAEFKPNRNQRRTLKKNSDLSVHFNSVQMSEENLNLCEQFLSSRYPQKNNTALGYYSGFFLNHIVTSLELHYRKNGQLLGNGIIDIGENWMNAVYFYFDTSESARSLGTFNILTMIDFCLQKNIQYLYLGYYIKNVPGMEYKTQFRPCYLRQNESWGFHL